MIQLPKGFWLNEVERCQEYIDKIPEANSMLKDLLVQCLDDEPDECPPISEVSEMIVSVKVIS